MEQIKDCVICLDSLNNNIENLPCNHILHTECIKRLIISNCPSKNKCPICRYPFKNKNTETSLIQPIINPIGPSDQTQIPLPIVQLMLFSQLFN